jgi:hypothetical protein
MHVEAVLLPLFIQVVLTFALLMATAILRRGALRDGVLPDEVSLGQPKWPPRATQVANAFRNQFELPVLFYVLCILAIITRQADNLFVVLAWLFVTLRLLHAGIHVTYNRLSHRGLVFALGCVSLMAMWIVFVVDVLIGL